MTSSKIFLVLLLMWFVMLQAAAAAEEDNEAQERRLDVVASLKKKQLYSLLDLLNTIGQQEQIFQKCFGAKAILYSEINEEEFEMVEIEHDGETTDRDVIVNLSNV